MVEAEWFRGVSGVILTKPRLLDPADDLMSLARNPNKFDDGLLDFASKFGQFNAELQPKLISIIRSLRLNPFIGFQSRARFTELAQLFGGSGLKGGSLARQGWYRAEVLWRGTIGTAATLAVLNKALSGNWPWENGEQFPGHGEDLNTGLTDSAGKPIFLPLSLLDPGLARAGRTVALWDMLDPRSGFNPVERWGRMAVHRMAQEVVGFHMGGPAVHTAMTSTFGKSMYVTPGGDLLQVAKPAYGPFGQFMNNLKAAAATLNPNLEIFVGDWVATHNEPSDERLKWFQIFGRAFLGKWYEMGPTEQLQNLSVA